MHIAKRSTKESKGILIITHKELSYLSVTVQIRKKNVLKMIFYPIFFLQRLLYSRLMMKLSDRYVIGVHWGASNVVEKTPLWVSFHMSAPGTAVINDGKYIIPLNSANFTPNIMCNKGYPKILYIICIAKNIKVKKLDKLLQSIREIYDAGRKFKIVLVVASNISEPFNKFYVNLLDDYNKLFSDGERENFIIVKTHPETGFKGLSTSFLSDLLNLTKIFTLFSAVEGESRVI